MTAIQRISDNKISVYARRLLKGDVYYARFKITNKKVADGQRYITESLNTTDEVEALDRARQRYAEICLLERENKPIKTGSVKAEIEAFMEQYEDGVAKGMRGYSKHMLTGFRKSIVRYFIEYIGSKSIQDVSADDLKQYESWRHGYWSKQISAGVVVHGNAKAKPALRTIEWEVNGFKQFLRWANERGTYSGNALTFKLVVEKKQTRSAFTAAQLDQLMAFAAKRSWRDGVGKHGHDARLSRYRRMLFAYIGFMVGTGLRPGEARHLRWRDISYTRTSDGKDSVEVFVHATHSKVNKTRITIGTDVAYMVLSSWHEWRKKQNDFAGPDDYLWCDNDGTVINDFREGFNTLIKAAGVETDSVGKKLAIYSLRHTYITMRRRESVSVYDLAQNTGTSVEMIQKFYDHVPTTERRDELTKYAGEERFRAR